MPRILSQEEIDAQFGGGFRAEVAPAGQMTRLANSGVGLASDLAGYGEAAGLPLGDVRRELQFQNEQTQQRFFRDNPNEPQSFRDVEDVGSALRYVRGLALDSAPQLAISALSGGAGAAMGLGRVGRIGLAAAANYPIGTADILKNQREESGQTNFGVASLLGIPYAAADMVGLDAALASGKMARTGIKALDEMRGFRGAAARTGANVAMNAPVEGASETFQELVNQAGRVAVNPNQTLFNPDANERYLESFVGGAALGGVASGAMGGWRRSEQYQAPQQETDLLNKQTQQTQAPAPQQYGLVTQPAPLQQRIDQQLGIGARTTPKDYAKQFEEAYNEPSGQYATDPQTGLEKQLTVGEYQQLTNAPLDLTESKPAEAAAVAATQAKIERDPTDLFIRDTLKVIPNQHSRALFGLMMESGVDPQADIMVPIWNYASDKYMSKGRYDKAVQMMDEAIINARKGAPSGTGVSTVQQPAGSVGVGGAVVPGTVGAAGSNAPIQGGVGGSAAPAGATSGQTSVLPSTTGQPSTTVTDQPVDLTAPAAPVTKFRRAPKPMTVLEAANAAKAAQAQQTETQGSQEPAQPVVDERQAVLQQIFGQRNGDIIFDVIGMGMSEPEAAAKYGLSRQAIQKIAGATGAETRAARVAKAKTELGLTDEQIKNAFTPPEQDVLGSAVEREIFGQAQPSSISETEAIEGGLENIVNTEGAGTSAVEGFTKLQKEIDATLEALQTETDEAKLEELNAKLAEQIVKVRAVEKRAQAEVRATAGKDTSTQVGEEDAVQVESTAVVPVQPETQTGKGVGKQVRRAEKPAGQGQTQGQAKGQVDRGRALWESLTAKTPGLVPYEQLTKLEQEYLTDLAVRTNGKPVVAKEMGLQQLLTKEPVTIDVEARVIDEQVTQQVAALPAPQVDRLEKHYGAKRDTAEFLEKVQADITKYVTQGAEAVAGAIRSIIKAMAEGVLAMGIVFNPNITKDAFNINVAKTFQQTIEVTQEVPEAAKAQMSPTAQAVYSAMAPVAMKSGKWFMVADKPNGMLHIFKEDGSHALSDATLYGKDKGDVLGAVSSLEGGPKITPAGKFTMKESPADYAGGTSLILMESKDYTGYIAVHAADTSTPSENRLGRLASATAEDNRISYGCINTKHDTFINEIKPNISKLDGGMMFILPEAEDQAAKMFAAETRTETRTEGGQGAKGKAAATLVGKEETIDAAVNRILRMSRQTAPLFSTDLYLGKENVAGQPQYGRELRNPVTLANGTRLDGFTSLDQSVFSGYDRNGQRVSVAQSAVKPEDVMSSRDSNRTANAVKAALGTRRLRLGRGDTVEVTAGTLKFDGQITDEASLRRFPGVESALAHYENNDLRHVIDKVELWMVAPDTVDFDAAIMMVDGKQTLAVRSGMLVDTDTANWSIHHELGHVADAAFTTGGIYSGLPEFNLTIQKGAVRPMGSVVSEVMAHMAENPDSAFTRSMGYPLDRSRSDTKNMTADEVRMEVFAQLWAFFNTRAGNNYLADNLPLTYDFMEASDEAAKQNKGSADAQTGATAAAAATQAQAYRGAERITPAILRIARPSEGLIKRNISKLPKAAQQPVRNSLSAIGDAVNKGLDYAVFTSDLVNRATASGIPSAKKFVDLIGKSKTEARENEIAVEKISDMYALVPEKDRGTGENSVNRFLFDSTREGKWGYGKYRDDAMGDRFDALSGESQAYVQAVFAHGSDVLAKKKKIVLDSTNSEYDAMIAAARLDGDVAAEAKLIKEKAATLKRFQTLFKLRDGIPYAPIKRNGSHVVIAKSQEYLNAEAANDRKKITELESDSDHYHVSFTDGKWEARTLRDELNDQGFFSDVQIAERDSVIDEMFSGHSALRELTKMRSKVDAQAADGDKSASKMLSLISQMYLEALAEGSARKSEMRRRGVAGEVDMIRSFAQQGRADAHFMASVKYNPQVQDALQEMRNQAKKGDRERKSEIFNELAKRYTQSMDYNERPWLNKLTRMSSLYYLATSPAYYLQNLTQPWMMSVPAMAGKYNYAQASGALFKAYTELGGVMKSAKLLKQQFDFDKVPSDVRDAIKELVNRGKIDIGLDTEMGEFKVGGDSYAAQKISAADKALRLAVQKVESINRLSTAMAAYRLELAKNGSKEDAINYADRILTETHGDYTSFNAPRIFNTGYGKVALQFRKFQLIQLSFYAKLIKDALSGTDRAAALKTLAYSLGHTATLAGAMGLPGYTAISWAINALLSDDDDKYDLTNELRKAIGDEQVANLVLRGAPTLIGADLSGKVGAGNMLSIQPFSKADLTTGAGIAEYVGTLIGGASLGMTTRMLDGLGLMMSGDWYRGIEQTMPKGISDAMKAYRVATEGMTRRNGDIILPPDEVSGMDTLFQAIGVQPVKQSVTYERQNLMKETTQNFTERTTKIKNDYVKAARAGDTEAQAEAREAWKKLQDVKRREGVNVSPLSDLLKAPAEQRKREKMTIGGVQYTKGTKKLAEEIAGD